ncbi:MAG: CpaE family protein [Alphaproteobacteria bacterium]
MIPVLAIDAFVLDGDFGAVLQRAAADRLLSRSKINLLPGGLPLAAAHYADTLTPSLLIVEMGSEASAVDELAELAEVCAPNTKVIVAGRRNDIVLYRTLLQQGVSDYLVLPVSPRQVVDAIDAVFTVPGSPRRGHRIGFIGARGGAGSSTVAGNTAFALTRLYQDEAILLDLDLSFGTTSLAFNQPASQAANGALAHPERLDATLLERFLVKYEERLRILPSSATLGSDTQVVSEALDVLLDLVGQMTPFVVLDLPRLWEPWLIHALTIVDELVITTTPDLAGLRDTKSLLDHMVRSRGEDAPVRIVLNRCGAYAKGELSAKDFGETLGRLPELSLPYNAPMFLEAFNSGQMMGQYPKSEKLAEAFQHLAAKVGGRQPPRQKKATSVASWIKGMIRKAGK